MPHPRAGLLTDVGQQHCVLRYRHEAMRQGKVGKRWVGGRRGGVGGRRGELLTE